MLSINVSDSPAEELINPPLRKRGDETDGTVEERLNLSAGLKGCGDPASAKDDQQPHLLQERARQTEGLEGNKHATVYSDVPVPPPTRVLELGAGDNDGEVILSSDREVNGIVRQAANDINKEVTEKIMCKCGKVAGAAPCVVSENCPQCLGKTPHLLNGAAVGESNGGGGVPGERQRVGKCREDVKQACLTKYLYVSNV